MRTPILAAAAALGLLGSAGLAQAQSVTIDAGGPARVHERTVIREGHDRGLHRGWEHRRYAERRDEDGNRSVRKTITRNPDGSVTRSKTVTHTQDDD